MNIIRGTGTSGLKGIKVKRDNQVVNLKDVKFDLVTEKMVSQGIGLRNSTNIYQDPIIRKYRMTGSFECRYNCITGAIEPNF